MRVIWKHSDRERLGKIKILVNYFKNPMQNLEDYTGTTDLSSYQPKPQSFPSAYQVF